MDFLFKFVLAEADGKRTGGNGISFVTGGCQASFFFSRVDHVLLEKGSNGRKKACVVDDLLHQCLHKGVIA